MKKELILKQAKYMLKGILRTLHGTATAGLLYFAVIVFTAVTGEGGYIAVADFALALATLGVALANVYLQGKGWKSKGRFSA